MTLHLMWQKKSRTLCAWSYRVYMYVACLSIVGKRAHLRATPPRISRPPRVRPTTHTEILMTLQQWHFNIDKIIHAVNVRVKVYNWTVYTVMRTLQNALVIANPCLGENNFLLMKNVIYSTVLSASYSIYCSTNF